MKKKCIFSHREKKNVGLASFVIGVKAGNPSRLGEEVKEPGVGFGGNEESLIGLQSVWPLPVLKSAFFTRAAPRRKSSRRDSYCADGHC